MGVPIARDRCSHFFASEVRIKLSFHGKHFTRWVGVWSQFFVRVTNTAGTNE